MASGRTTWQKWAMAGSPKTPMAGGFLLAASILIGAFVGAGRGQASIGFLTGAGIGLVLLLAVWLIDRRRFR